MWCRDKQARVPVCGRRGPHTGLAHVATTADGWAASALPASPASPASLCGGVLGRGAGPAREAAARPAGSHSDSRWALVVVGLPACLPRVLPLPSQPVVVTPPARDNLA